MKHTDKGQRIGFNGTRVRQLRRQKGLSADQLARMTELTTRHIYRLERNELPQVWAITVAKLALALGTSLDYLMGLTDDPRPYRQEAGQGEQLEGGGQDD